MMKGVEGCAKGLIGESTTLSCTCERSRGLSALFSSDSLL